MKPTWNHSTNWILGNNRRLLVLALITRHLWKNKKSDLIIAYHFVREGWCGSRDEWRLAYINMHENNVADLFTKPLPASSRDKKMSFIRMVVYHIWRWDGSGVDIIFNMYVETSTQIRFKWFSSIIWISSSQNKRYQIFDLVTLTRCAIK